MYAFIFKPITPLNTEAALVGNQIKEEDYANTLLLVNVLLCYAYGNLH